MNTDGNSVRGPGETREVWGVTPVSDHNPNGQARRNGKRKVRRMKNKPEHRDQDEPAESSNPDREGEPQDQTQPSDDGHTVDHLA